MAGYALCLAPYQPTVEDDRFHENEHTAYYAVILGQARYEAIRDDPTLMPSKSDVPRGTYMLSFLAYLDEVSLERFGMRFLQTPEEWFRSFIE